MAGVVGRPDVGKQYVLNTRTDGPHGQVTACELFDLDHAAEVREQLDGPTDVVKVVHRPGGVLSHELDVVELAGLPDQLGDGGPGRQQVGAEAGPALGEALAEAVLT
jgi:hypothetical protein